MRSRNFQRRCAQMPLKQTPKMPRPDPHALGKLLQIAAIQRALGNQLERPGNDCPSPEPCGTPRRGVRTAPSARSKSGRFRSRGGLEPSDALRMAEGHRADGPAINPSGGDAAKETPVETLVAAVYRLPAKGRVKLQAPAGGGAFSVRPGAGRGKSFVQNYIRETIFCIRMTLSPAYCAPFPGASLPRLRKNTSFCHSERSEESL